MDRRDTIKSLLLGGMAGGLVLQGCETEADTVNQDSNTGEEPGGGYGRTPEEMERDKRLMAEQFFSEHEMATITVLCDIILPASENAGSAIDAGVPEFIEFAVKDMTHYQLPMRGGLMWLDLEANHRYNSKFVDLSGENQLSIIDDIAYPDDVKPEHTQGAKFFSLMRDLTVSGYYTTRMGIDDLGYAGNIPNTWDGVPPEVLERHGMSYDEEWLSKCIDQNTRAEMPKWDDDKNLIG